MAKKYPTDAPRNGSQPTPTPTPTPTATPAPAAGLRKLIDIGPGGVLNPCSAQDYRYYSNASYFAAINAVYAEYFAAYKPARIFICTAGWFGPFDMEIDCVALAK